MTHAFEAIERCFEHASNPAGGQALIQALCDPDWRVRAAAATGLGDRREPAAVAPLLALLDAEDAAPLYTQARDYGGVPAGAPELPADAPPPETPPATLTAWRRRGRLKQCVCLALGAIGIADAAVLARLQRYATDTREDYLVRAAACKALGQIPDPSSRPALDHAAGDEEWCTRTEATKAMRTL